jgi:hypothetical protein
VIAFNLLSGVHIAKGPILRNLASRIYLQEALAAPHRERGCEWLPEGLAYLPSKNQHRLAALSSTVSQLVCVPMTGMSPFC